MAKKLRKHSNHKRSKGQFRLRVSDDGTFASTSTSPARALTAAVARSTGMTEAKRGGATEVWVVRRRDEDFSVLAVKLTGANPKAPKGSLRPELAAALVRCVPLGPDDVVLDPFSGSGAIGVAALRLGVKGVWLNDLHEEPTLATTEARGKAKLHHTKLDFRDLASSNGPRPTAVITDPPWGLFGAQPASVERLYQDRVIGLGNRLPPGGKFVVLTGADEAALSWLRAASKLQVDEEVPILVNGKKARVLIGHTRT